MTGELKVMDRENQPKRTERSDLKVQPEVARWAVAL